MRTLPLLNNVPESQLPAIAKAELEKYKRAGFDGTFTTWGVPRAAHGDIADIEDSEYPEHNGSYYMKKVEISASADGGFRRTITLHKQTVPLTTDKVRKQRAKQKS